MTSLILKTPLIWPSHKSKTPASQRSTPPGVKGDMSYSEAISQLQLDLADKIYDKAILYTCYENLENDRLRKRVDTGHGASLMLSIAGEEYLLACDVWSLTQHNIYALYLTLHTLHQAEKWQVDGINVFLQGFARTRKSMTPTESSAPVEPWREILGLGPSAKLIDANATYRARAKEMAANEGALMRLNQAIEEARKVLT